MHDALWLKELGFSILEKGKLQRATFGAFYGLHGGYQKEAGFSQWRMLIRCKSSVERDWFCPLLKSNMEGDLGAGKAVNTRAH